MEGCSNLGGFALCSSSLLTLWLSGLHSLSKMVIVFLFTLVSHAVADFSISYFSFVFTSTSLLLIHIRFSQVFNCPNLKEISIDFSRQGNDNTDIITMVDGLGRNCPRLQNIHIASVRLSHAVVLALTAAQLRFGFI